MVYIGMTSGEDNVLSRLRLGCTFLNQQHLMVGKHVSGKWEFSADTEIIGHVIMTCDKYAGLCRMFKE